MSEWKLVDHTRVTRWGITVVGRRWPGGPLIVTGWPDEEDADALRCHAPTVAGVRCRNRVFPGGQVAATHDDGTATLTESDWDRVVAGACWLHRETA